MRPISLGAETCKDPIAERKLQEIERASREADVAEIANGYTITGSYTATRTLNVGVSTLAQTQAFLATLIADLQRGGENRST